MKKMKEKKNKRTSLYLTESVKGILERLSIQLNISQNAIITLALLEYAQREIAKEIVNESENVA